MAYKKHLAAINAIIAVTDTKRAMTISQGSDERFTVALESGRGATKRNATAPQLCHALLALEYLDDGESVLLDESGNLLGDEVPGLWPSEGLLKATLTKYAWVP